MSRRALLLPSIGVPLLVAAVLIAPRFQAAPGTHSRDGLPDCSAPSPTTVAADRLTTPAGSREGAGAADQD